MFLKLPNLSIYSHISPIYKSAIDYKRSSLFAKWIVATLCIVSLWALFPIPGVIAQELDLEELLESDSEGEEQSELVEYLYSLIQQPLDLNRVSSKELQTIPWITPTLARRIIAFRNKHGKFVHTSQLLQVRGLDNDTYNIIRHFLHVYEHKIPINVHLTSRQRISTRLEQPYGYQKNVYAGTKQKYYNRAVLGISEFASGGVLLEKDAGERRFNDLALGFLKLHLRSLHTEILLGNYKFEVGQGLVFWGPYGFGKSNNAVAPIKKRSRGLREYLSVDENAGLYGVAVSTKVRWLHLTGLYSRTCLNATISGDGEITSIYTSGYHRTDSEQNKQDAARETLYGCRARIDVAKNARISATVQSSCYEPGFESPTVGEWSSSLQSNRNRVASADFDLVVGRTNLFGELAQSKSSGRALYSGMIVDCGSFDFALSVRRYDRHYQNPHGFAFGERNGSGQNEHGYYLGLRGKVLPTTRFSFYFDQFKHPWPSATTPMPVHGWDSVSLIEQKLGRKLNLYAKIRIKNKEQTTTVQDEYGRKQCKLVFQRKISARLQLQCSMVPRLTLRSRIEKVWVRWDDLGGRIDAPPNSQGVMLFQDIRVDISQRMLINLRLTFFDTESYDARLYQYETAMPGMWSSRMLYGKGTRWYVIVRFNAARWLKANVKYSCTIYDDRDSIGSGWETIDGDTDHRLDFQLDLNIK